MHKALVALSLVAVLAFAQDAFAFGGGGKKGGSGGGSVAGAGFTGSSSIAAVSLPNGPVSTPEPFAALAVGLGLVGARLLRRK